MLVRWGVACLAVACVIVHCSLARAWYFPEHAELTRLALRDFAPAFATASIDKVMAEAAAQGLKVCGSATTPLHATATESDAIGCVPYGALAALAGDHANTIEDLRGSLREPIGRWPLKTSVLAALLTAAARDTWIDFQEDAPPEVVRTWTMDVTWLSTATARLPKSSSPRNYVRSLDAKLLAIDAHYIDRAKNAKTHFHDPTSKIETTLVEAVAGNLDNALAQVMAHHLRSLVLAAKGSSQTDLELAKQLRVNALLEHAFALHFLEDGFAAGHIATDPAVAADERRAQRHDFFNRQGLAVTRALARRRCSERDLDSSRSMGLALCWTAHGDGFATADDRVYVGEAVARLQTSFALALDGLGEKWVEEHTNSAVCKGWAGADSSATPACDIAWAAMLLDPNPRWTLPEDTSPSTPADAEWATKIIVEHLKAIEDLREVSIPVLASAGSAGGQPGTLPLALVREATVSGISALLRPILVVWPEAQADVVTLAGSDQFGRGWNFQVVVNAAVSDSNPFYSDAVLRAWTAVGAGVAYNAQGVFPHRRTRALIEANLGVAEGLLVAGDAERFRTVLVGELRVPITTLMLHGVAMLWHSAGPLSLVGRKPSIGLYGARVYLASDRDRVLFTGWDVELLNAVLDNVDSARAAAGAGLLDTELRGRIGWRSKDSDVELDSLFGGTWFLTLELSSGFFASPF